MQIGGRQFWPIECSCQQVLTIDACVQIPTACSNDDYTSLTKAQTKPSCFRRTSHTACCCDHSWYEASGAIVRARQCAWSKTFSKFVDTLLHLKVIPGYRSHYRTFSSCRRDHTEHVHIRGFVRFALHRLASPIPTKIARVVAKTSAHAAAP